MTRSDIICAALCAPAFVAFWLWVFLVVLK